MEKNYTYKYRKSFVIGHKPDGKPIRKDIKTNSAKEFKLLCKKYEQLTAKGILLNGSRQTVEEWAWRWFATYKKPNIGVSQQKNYDAILRLHILPALGYMALEDVRGYHLQDFLNTQAGKSKSQLDKIRGTLVQMFERAEIDRLIEYSPARKLLLPESTEKQLRHLTEPERQALYAVLPTHQANVWVRFMLQCGLRRGETVPLTWGDIDFEQAILTVNKAVEYISNQPHIKSTKTKAGVRHVPIPPDFLEILKQRKRIRKENDEHLILYNRDGHMMTEIKLKNLWRSVCRAWELQLGAQTYRNRITRHALDQDITPHYLRHTYCTDLRRAGIDLKTAQALMGHADIRTTANIYNHFDQSDAVKAGEKLYSVSTSFPHASENIRENPRSSENIPKFTFPVFLHILHNKALKSAQNYKKPLFSGGFSWWTLGDSNPRPSARQADALPAELSVQIKAVKPLLLLFSFLFQIGEVKFQFFTAGGAADGTLFQHIVI